MGLNPKMIQQMQQRLLKTQEELGQPTVQNHNAQRCRRSGESKGRVTDGDLTHLEGDVGGQHPHPEQAERGHPKRWVKI